MDVRKFEAFSMQDAIRLVKKELGPEAVILSTRERQAPAQAGGKPTRVVEVMAARSASSSAVHPAGTSATKVEFPRMAKSNEAIVVKGSPALPQLKADLRNVQGTQGQARPVGTYAPTAAARAQGIAAGTSSAAAAAKGEGLRDRLLSDVRAGASEEARELNEVRGELKALRREMESLPQVNVGQQFEEIKVLLFDLMRDHNRREQQGQNEYVTDLSVKLRAAGVTESLLSELDSTLSGLKLPLDESGIALNGARLREFYLQQSIRYLFRQFGVTGAFKAPEGQQQIHCLVGPTGVGKTTTIAKLAARMKVESGKRVALCSMDSVRVAASDQLRIYSKILDCPFAEAADEAELQEFIARNHQADAVFVDTAGRSARFPEQMEALRGLRACAVPLRFHLVLSGGSKLRDLLETVKAFKALDPESVMFTKLDECWGFGEILSTAACGKIPISYFATGQKVPEDLEVATKERVVERLFRL